jgi:hypothetical protein
MGKKIFGKENKSDFFRPVPTTRSCVNYNYSGINIFLFEDFDCFMNIKTLKYIALVLLISCTKNESKVATNERTDGHSTITTNTESTRPSGYNELSNEDSLDQSTISSYNTDIEDRANINRPDKSKIENSKFPADKLFGIWVEDPGPETPHATFQLTEKSFFVVDYDGDGDMPYVIKGDSITVYFNDFITKGKIIESKNNGELKIHWEDSDTPTTYYTWKN